jgi:hypothetical protein
MPQVGPLSRTATVGRIVEFGGNPPQPSQIDHQAGANALQAHKDKGGGTVRVFASQYALYPHQPEKGVEQPMIATEHPRRDQAFASTMRKTDGSVVSA